MKINEEHFYFASNNHKLYGMLYEPEMANQNSENYIILHPFAEEKKSSQRVLVDLARSLCKNGNKVLLFDLYGCGDSEGELSDACISIWLENIKHASSFLKKKTNIKSINIIGLRLGAFLGFVYAKNSDDINKLILIEPVMNPAKDLLRSLRSKLMKELCTDGEIKSNRKDLLANLNNDNSIDFSGHEINGKFYHDLLKYNEEISYEALVKRGKNVLLINISQMGKPTRQFQKLLSGMDNVNLIHNKVIKLEPFWGQIDLPDCSELIEKVVEWCTSNGVRKPETGDGTEVSSKQLKVNSKSKKNDKPPVPNTQCLISNPTTPPKLISNSDYNFKESVLTIQNENYKIFGILTEPPKDNFKGITIVFLHGWAGYRIGPHRIFTDYARKLAELGFHTVRFDFRGKGFSQLDKEPNNKTQLSDLECVLNYLHQFELPDIIILTGICSGARLALYYAMKGQKPIENVIELSTTVLRPDNQMQVEISRTRSTIKEYIAKLNKKETWYKLIKRELRLKLIYKIVSEPIMNLIKLLFRKRSSNKKSNNNANEKKHKDAFLNFKDDILASHGEKDPGTEVALKQVTNLTNKYLIPLEKHIIKGANHSFYSIEWKNEIFEIIKQWLIKKYPVISNQ